MLTGRERLVPSSLQVKHLDDDLSDALRRRAAAADQTISEYVVDMLRRDLRRSATHEWIERARALTPTGRTSAEVASIRNGSRSDSSTRTSS